MVSVQICKCSNSESSVMWTKALHIVHVVIL